jgi:Holliday junction resolvase-like predicted endonuclease
MPLTAWRIGTRGPERARRGKIDLESSLEDWIEADPDLVLNGLAIVGRQVGLAGGRLDLLGIDPTGRWVVIELKPGPLYQDVITQALGYVASLRKLSPESLRSKARSYLERHPNPDASARVDASLPDDEDSTAPEIRALVVGTSRDPGLDRLMELLTDHDVAIEAVTFEPFELPDGGMIMVREITETSAAETRTESISRAEKLKGVLEYAEENGDKALFEQFLEAGEDNGLHARPYVASVMFAPPANKTRMLFTIWTDKRGAWLDTAHEAFEEFFPEVSTDQALHRLGPERRRQLDQDGAASFLAGLENLFAEARGGAPGISS